VETKKQLRVGIYGGSFDPVHNMHSRLANIVTAYLDLDRLEWVPTGASWHKAGHLSDAKDRINMLELAFQSTAASIREKWQINTCEIERQGNSYTIDTVKLLQENQDFAQAQWYLVIGADQFNVLHTWKDWPELLERVTLAVFDRAGVDLDVAPEVLEKARWERIPVTPSPLSSSEIRALVEKLSTPVLQSPAYVVERLYEFLPPFVPEYIVEHGLYVNEKLQDWK